MKGDLGIDPGDPKSSSLVVFKPSEALPPSCVGEQKSLVLTQFREASSVLQGSCLIYYGWAVGAAAGELSEAGLLWHQAYYVFVSAHPQPFTLRN